MKKEELKKLIDTAAGRIPSRYSHQKLSDRQCFFRKDPDRAISLCAEIRSQESESIRV